MNNIGASIEKREHGSVARSSMLGRIVSLLCAPLFSISKKYRRVEGEPVFPYCVPWEERRQIHPHMSGEHVRHSHRFYLTEHSCERCSCIGKSFYPEEMCKDFFIPQTHEMRTPFCTGKDHDSEGNGLSIDPHSVWRICLPLSTQIIH